MCGPRVSLNVLFFYVYRLFHHTAEVLETMISQFLKQRPGNLLPVSHATFAPNQGSGAIEISMMMRKIVNLYVWGTLTENKPT